MGGIYGKDINLKMRCENRVEAVRSTASKREFVVQTFLGVETKRMNPNFLKELMDGLATATNVTSSGKSSAL